MIFILFDLSNREGNREQGTGNREQGRVSCESPCWI